ncbi:MAG: peptidase M14 [Leptolyngbya sp. PLA2]|nr:peptidase M14 [Leptolyngbya sp. PL-A2]MCQ3940476.1 peptidase M14 [cyanobacterium CYA1]MCZ7633940.1 M14 family metallopeptidase [Phycisphaerales bacterium]MDL1904326.1 peptidase M14 [Synechococcales cyanobacterium CNB]GIK19556.1 MAG: peptidase M14 [Planctomycetota bacterium]
MRTASAILAAMTLGTVAAVPASAQPHIDGKVEIAFNRYYTYAEIEAHLKRIAAAYPDLVELREIGRSLQGRALWVAIVNSPKTGPHTSKPAMWIDGNVHGNEVQSAEAVLYSLWYLTKAYGQVPSLTDLLDRCSFYFMVSVNPDGREYWFEEANTPHSSRSNQRPVDDDRDGLFDEDPPDDLDGDGSITQMWIRDPDGRWERDRHDPRVFRRVPDDKRGEWTPLGSEGIDNDGDGRINEDGPGGDDMNRNWPSGWKPEYAQGGAGEFPFSNPETRAVGAFIMAHTNIAAGQSYHNAGGMILRGPGAQFRDGFYPRADARVYDEIARVGEDMLPYYRSMIIWRDLYTVHGGFVNWLAEGLGIISFTNELWTNARYFQRDVSEPDDQRMWLFRDRLQFGLAFKEYTEFEHPQYGTVLVGGMNKWSSRSTPTFMLEEECHRNFAFTMFHADQMPLLAFERVETARAGDGLWTVTVQVRNDRLIPTRTAVQAQRRIGTNDLLTCEPLGGGRVAASGSMNSWRDTRVDPVLFEPGRMQLTSGVPGRGSVIHRFYVEGKPGEAVRLRYTGERTKDVETTVTLGE